MGSVLIVGESGQAGEALADALQLAGWDAVVATTIGEAVSAAEHIQIDVVLVEEVFADGTARQLEALFTDRPQLSQTSFVYMNDAADHDGSTGRRGVLRKPFTTEQAAAVLQDALRKPCQR